MSFLSFKSAPKSRVVPWLASILLSLAVALAILGGRWKVIERFGTDMPEWDEWDAEGTKVLSPWFENGDVLQGILAPHNEHRVVLTKATGLALTLANGQWDQRLTAALNSLLPAALAAGLLFWLRPAMPRWLLPLFAVFLAALWALPLAWQNVIGGFHSQQFFLINLSFVAIAFLPYAKPWSGRWWTLVAAAILALGSMGSGFFAATVLAGQALLLWWFRKEPVRHWLPLFIFGTLVTIFGYATRAQITYHDSLKATSVADFLGTMLHALEWPLMRHAWAPLFLWTPWIWLSVRWLVVRNERERDALGLGLLGLGTWVILQTVATGLMRGAGAPYPASRYLDTYAFGAAINAGCLVWLFRGNLSRFSKIAGIVLAGGWLGTFGYGLKIEVRSNLFDQLPPAINYHRECERNSRAYLRTGNQGYLIPGQIPYPHVPFFAAFLDQPSLRPLMPASIRLPIVDLKPAKISGFYSPALPPKNEVLNPESHDGIPPDIRVLGPEPIWTSFTAEREASTGSWTSEPFVSPEPYMRLEVAGTQDDPLVKLELRSAKTHRLLAPIVAHHRGARNFQPVYVRVPAEPVYLEATDASVHGWLAFSSPTAMARGSYLAKITIHEGYFLIYAAGILLLAASGLLYCDSRRASECDPN